MTNPLLKVRDLKIAARIFPPGERPRDIEIVHGVDFDLEGGNVLRCPRSIVTSQG